MNVKASEVYVIQYEETISEKKFWLENDTSKPPNCLSYNTFHYKGPNLEVLNCATRQLGFLEALKKLKMAFGNPIPQVVEFQTLEAFIHSQSLRSFFQKGLVLTQPMAIF